MFYLNWFISIAVFCWFLNGATGANDESMAIAYGSKTMSLNVCLIVGGLAEIAGSVLFGTNVAITIQDKLFDLSLFVGQLELLMITVLGAVIGSTVWMIVASIFGMPISSTHSLISSIAFAALTAKGTEGIHWEQMGFIVLSWVISPLLGGLVLFIAFTLFHVIFLRDRDRSYQRIKNWMSVIGSIIVCFLVFFVIFKGIKLPKETPLWIPIVSVILGCAALGLLCHFLVIPILVRRIESGNTRVYSSEYADSKTENLVSYLQIVTATLFSFARGASDSSHAAGPFALAYSIFMYGPTALTSKTAEIPLWILACCGLSMAIGLFTIGRRVVRMVGDQITDITPTNGVMCELSTAISILVFSALGIPISSSHTLIGVVFFMGKIRQYILPRLTCCMTNRIDAIPVSSSMVSISDDIAQLDNETHLVVLDPIADINTVSFLYCFIITKELRTALKIVASWVITVPVSGAISAAVVAALVAIFNPEQIPSLTPTPILNTTLTTNTTLTPSIAI